MGRFVKKVVAELFSEEVERRELLSHGRFGSCKRKSAIDAPAITVDRAHTGLD